MSKKIIFFLSLTLLTLLFRAETIFFSQVMKAAEEDFYFTVYHALQSKLKPADFRIQETLQILRQQQLSPDYESFKAELKTIIFSLPQLQELYQQYTLGLAMEIDNFFFEENYYLEKLKENLTTAERLLQVSRELQTKHFYLVLESNGISQKKWKKLKKFQLPVNFDSSPDFFLELQKAIDSEADRDTTRFVLAVLNQYESGRQAWFSFGQLFYQHLKEIFPLIKKIKEVEDGRNR